MTISGAGYVVSVVLMTCPVQKSSCGCVQRDGHCGIPAGLYFQNRGSDSAHECSLLSHAYTVRTIEK